MCHYVIFLATQQVTNKIRTKIDVNIPRQFFRQNLLFLRFIFFSMPHMQEELAWLGGSCGRIVRLLETVGPKCAAAVRSKKNYLQKDIVNWQISVWKAATNNQRRGKATHIYQTIKDCGQILLLTRRSLQRHLQKLKS